MFSKSVMMETALVIVLLVVAVALPRAVFAQPDGFAAAVRSGDVDKAALNRFLAEVPEDRRGALVDSLIPHLQSSDWVPRACAAYVLGCIGPKAAPAIPGLIRAMDMNMQNIAWEVIPALSKIGSPSVAVLIEELKTGAAAGEKANLQTSHAIQAVAGLGPMARDAAPSLVPFLNDGANTGAVKALLAIGPDCLPAVCQGLDSPDGRVPVYAAELLSGLQPAATTHLVAYVGIASPRGRQHASYVLAHLKPPPGVEAAPVLCGLLGDGNPEVAGNAVIALKAMGPAVVPEVAKVLSSDNAEACQKAADILRSFGPDARAASGALQELMSGQDLERKTLAAATLLRTDPDNPEALRLLIHLVQSPNPAYRSVALMSFALAGPGAGKAVLALTKALGDSEVGNRVQAAEALGEVASGARSAVPELARALTIPHPKMRYGKESVGGEARVYRAVLEALGKIGPDAAAAVPQMAAILEEKEKSYLDEEVCQALASMTSVAAPAVPALCRKLSSGNPAPFIETLAAIGAAAKPALPGLEQLVGSAQGSWKHPPFKAMMRIETDDRKKQELALRYVKDEALSGLAFAALAQVPHPGPEAWPVLLAEFKDLSPYDHRVLDIIKALGNAGPAVSEALPKLIADNIGSSYSEWAKKAAFDAIKQIDPTGEKTLALVKPVLEDPFQVRGSVELLEHLASPECKEVARAVRIRWKL